MVSYCPTLPWTRVLTTMLVANEHSKGKPLVTLRRELLANASGTCSGRDVTTFSSCGPESERWVSGGAFFMDSYSDRDNVT